MSKKQGLGKLQWAIAEACRAQSYVPNLHKEIEYTCTQPKCKNAKVVKDDEKGDRVCTNCGLVLSERESVDVAYGEGVGQHCFGTVEGDYLDKKAGLKAFAGAKTTREHKLKQKREAGDEIDGLVDDDVVAKRAKLMYERYVDSRNKVGSNDKVIKACVALASNPYFRGIPKALGFKCDGCGKVFNCKKGRRWHECTKVFKIKSRRAATTVTG